MSRLICPVCDEDVVPGRPHGGDGRGWSRGVQPERMPSCGCSCRECLNGNHGDCYVKPH